ncbi:MAG TPA: SDR family NAD(P)-dependent oxidoreductase [Rhizomicrobium sp.]|nr:SDR family NAD(P)-dependent oxidoreductase [Rhizomicrobium sp.]
MSGLLGKKRILITGASGGLGQAVVQAFLREGAIVAGVARRWPKEERPQGILTIEADVGTPDGAEAAVRALVEPHGGIDAAVHLVGGFAMDGPVEATKVETWDRMMEVNARSAFLVFRAALPRMLEAGHGRLLAVGSRAGAEGAPGAAAYAVSKSALHALVLNLAAELRLKAITVNAVLPGTIDTPANRAAMPKADFTKWVAPEAIADTLVWLASDQSAETSGALIPVYGRS